ncbi:ABC transporter permease [Nocardiopsis kunsanensis]|uniref:ABC transporter permease n=1 Tax=Nocardiopsis kunsanensis TaxID=141693 RepID=UPI00034D5B87|nr:ABC transporter permease [Nocardiopsis kunsanensis]
MTATGSDRISAPTIRDDPSLATVVAVEWEKLRRGFCLWLSLALPFVLILPLGLIAAFSPEGQAGDVWGIWFSVTLLFWGMFLPMGAALYAAMSVRADLDSRQVVYAYAFPRHRLLIGRFLALLLQWAVSALLLTVLLATVGALLIGPEAALPVPAGVLVPWLGAAATLALCLMMAERWGTGPTAVVGVLGMLLGGIIADTSAWWFVPMVWPMRAVVPLAGIEANGVPLEPGDPLFSTAPLPVVVVLSFTLSIVLLAAGARHVNRKEL